MISLTIQSIFTISISNVYINLELYESIENTNEINEPFDLSKKKHYSQIFLNQTETW